MMKRIAAVTAAVCSLFAVVLLAGGLSKYKGWDKSPQGYLMTAEERAQWASSVKSDADAEKFVQDFLAKRGPNFPKEVEQAAAAADKYFTAGNIKGSSTERGKLVIVLGPPGAISLATKDVKADYRNSPDSAMNVGGASAGAGGGGGQGASVADMMGAQRGPGSGGGTVREYTITYPPQKLPASYGKELVVKIQLNGDGSDYLGDRNTKAELDRLYEMVAQSKLAANTTPAAAH
jgi:GWxTD domain-containing protein